MEYYIDHNLHLECPCNRPFYNRFASPDKVIQSSFIPSVFNFLSIRQNKVGPRSQLQDILIAYFLRFAENHKSFVNSIEQ